MIWPRTRGATPITLAWTMASSVRGCRSTILQTQSTSTTTPTIKLTFKIRPAILRHSMWFWGVFAGVWSTGEIELGSAIRILVFKKHQPNGQGEKNGKTKIRQKDWVQCGAQSETNDKLPR